jgi:glutamine amidotransferase
LARGEKIVLPGVGAFRDAMERLRGRRLDAPLVKAVNEGIPFLGICLGLQLLFDVSYEDGEHTGLGVLPGKVVRFSFDAGITAQRLTVPHMGWNQVRWEADVPMLLGIDSGAYVYFAHSYHVVPINAEATATSTEYGYTFTSSVWRGNLFATQFHPEKSQDVGLRLLENFVRL